MGSPEPSGNCWQPTLSADLTENFHALSNLDVRSCAGNRTAGDIGDRAGGRFWQVSRLQRSMGSHRPPNNWRQLAGPPPLTPEYQKVFDASVADQRGGRPGNWPSTFCIPEGMPAMMNLYNPMEIIVTPETTYILMSHNNDVYRR